MSGIDEIKKIRIKKLKALQSAGVFPYPEKAKRTHACAEALETFGKLSRAKKEVFLAGRMMSLREHGALTFCHIEDSSAKIQILLKKDNLGEKSYQFFLDHFDIGDFIQVKGELFKTQRGEKTLLIKDYKLLSKSILSLPEKWHGVKDIEERYRKRYLDLIFNPEIKEKFKIRSRIIKELRSFLEGQGFLEVETPILQPVYGGASARPFKTRLNALSRNLYLRISPELYLKRLLIAGLEKVYEIGRCFRNEGIDRFHNPDFTMLEFYWAYADYKDLMKFTEQMFNNLLLGLFGSLEIEYQGKKLNFKTPWPRVEFEEIFKKYTGINLEEINITALKKQALKFGLEAQGGKFEIADQIYKKVCRPKIEQPIFIINYPAQAFPLAKQLDKNPSKSASFQMVAMGTELVKAYSELNDPILQKKRFQEQEKIFKQGFGEAQKMDKDFIEALEYGMPPAAGWGLGIDRLAALLTDSHSLREIILFPTMRSK